MPFSCRASRRLLRHSALATAAVLALLGGQPASADSSITVGSNNWLGSADTDWFHSANWWGGNVFALPNPLFPVYVGPSQWVVNGVPTDTYDLPSSEAVLRGAFSTSSLEMRAWDGISRIRLETGALLTVGSATVGQLHPVYQATGPIQKATLVLAGGQLAGSWSFQAQSRVVVEAPYGVPTGNWSGELSELQINSGASLSLPAGSLTIGQIHNAGALSVGAGRNISLAGTVTNNGTFTLGGSGNQGTAAVYLSGDTTLAGTGSTVLTDASYSYIGGAGLLTVGQGHTLRGKGYVATGIANRGTVIAEGVLTVNGAGSTNFDNSAGLVQVADGSMLSLASGTLSGGTLQGLGAGSRIGGNGTLRDLALQGSWSVAAGSPLTVAGTLAGAGTLTLRGSGNTGTAAVYLADDTTLAGTGSTVLTDANYSYIGGTGALTVTGAHTLRGAGYVATSITNRSTVIADGVLNVNGAGSTHFDNSAGQVQVADGGMLSLVGGTFNGGTLQGLGPGSRLGGNGSVQDTALSGQLLLTGSTTLANLSSSAQLELRGSNNISTRGTLTSTGTLTIRGSGNTGSAAVYLADDTTLAGSGSTVLTDANYSYIGGTGKLTIGQGHTLRGQGYVAVGMANQGTVIAEGVLSVNGAGNTHFDNSAGLVQVADGGMLSLVGGSFSGGTLQGLGPGSRIGGNGSFQNLALQGTWTVAAGSPLTVAGTLAGNSTLTVRGSGSTGSAAVYLAADTTLAGTGSTVLTDANYSSIGGSGVLTIGQGHTLRGSGHLSVAVANQGTVQVGSGQALTFASGGLHNQGQLQVLAGGMLNATNLPEGIVQDGAAAVTTVNGVLQASTLRLEAGTLKGGGTVQADIVNLGGTIAAGNSPGTLTVAGDLSLGNGSLLVVEVAGLAQGVQYDWLKVLGNVALGGSVQFDFGSYTPAIGEQYSFLTSASGGIRGSFSRAFANGYALSLDYGAQGITARVDAISAVPEPATDGLMLLGLGLVAALARRRAHRQL